MGLRVPVWDIAKRFRNAVEVTTIEQGCDLARTLGKNRVCLIRGTGYIVTGRTLNVNEARPKTEHAGGGGRDRGGRGGDRGGGRGGDRGGRGGGGGGRW